MLPWELYVKSKARIDAKAREESTARLIEWYLAEYEGVDPKRLRRSKKAKKIQKG